MYRNTDWNRNDLEKYKSSLKIFQIVQKIVCMKCVKYTVGMVTIQQNDGFTHFWNKFLSIIVENNIRVKLILKY